MELDDGPLPRDGNSGQQCADSPSVSRKSYDDAHHGEWEFAQVGWPYEMHAHQGEHVSRHWRPSLMDHYPLPILDGASWRTVADHDCRGVCHQQFDVTWAVLEPQQP